MKQLILGQFMLPLLRYSTKTIVVLLAIVFITCLVSQSLLAAPIDDFVTTWKTDNPGWSNNTTIRVYMRGGPYDVDWDNDGVFDEFGISGTATHDYMVAGTYTIRIRGSYDSIEMAFSNGRFIESLGDELKIISLDQWGTHQWKSMDLAFWGARKLRIPATDTPDLSAVTSMWGMFERATNANPDVSNWDTSAVRWMGSMFFGAHAANPDVSGWDTSAVTSMSSMFSRTTAANPDVSNWDTSAVTNMRYMFQAATSFNQNLGTWDVTALTDAWSMFAGVKLSPENYEALLIGWSAQELNSEVRFDGGDSTYCSAEAAAARERMIADYSWEILDGGQSCYPTDISATDGDYPNFVRVTFNPVEDATVYRIFRCPDKGNTCGSPIGYTKTTSFDDSKGSSEQVYYYRVRACTTITCGKFSVANAGHRVVVSTAKSDKSIVVMDDVSSLSSIDIPIPSINDVGRWLLILVTLGFGLLLLYSKED